MLDLDKLPKSAVVYQAVFTHRRQWANAWLEIASMRLHERTGYSKLLHTTKSSHYKTIPRLCIIAVSYDSTKKLPWPHTYRAGFWNYNAQSEDLLHQFARFFHLALHK